AVPPPGRGAGRRRHPPPHLRDHRAVDAALREPGLHRGHPSLAAAHVARHRHLGRPPDRLRNGAGRGRGGTPPCRQKANPMRRLRLIATLCLPLGFGLGLPGCALTRPPAQVEAPTPAQGGEAVWGLQARLPGDTTMLCDNHPPLYLDAVQG
ncbi:hypothetical protein KXX48_000817, partial [Aspergillus fumigatus]